MAQFKYKAQSLDQKKITGTMNAADESKICFCFLLRR